MNIYIIILLLLVTSIIFYVTYNFINIDLKLLFNLEIKKDDNLKRAYIYLFIFLIFILAFSIMIFLKQEFSIFNLNYFKIINYNLPLLVFIFVIVFIVYIKQFIYILFSNNLLMFKASLIIAATIANVIITSLFIKKIVIVSNIITILSNLHFSYQLLKNKNNLSNMLFTYIFIFNLIILFINSFALFYCLFLI